MKNSYVKYFLIISVVVSAICFASTLSAGESNTIVCNVDAQVPEALTVFIKKAVQQGLSIEQIVELALLQGYLKEQVTEACSVIMDQENNESMSPSKKLMWGIAGTVVLGVGVWYLYQWLKPVTENDEGPRVNGQQLTIVPANGLVLPNNGNDRLNELFQQRLARDEDENAVIDNIRQRYPNIQLQVNIRRNDVWGHNRYEAWDIEFPQYPSFFPPVATE